MFVLSSDYKHILIRAEQIRAEQIRAEQIRAEQIRAEQISLNLGLISK
jgi:hypothetical protein